LSLPLAVGIRIRTLLGEKEEKRISATKRIHGCSADGYDAGILRVAEVGDPHV
jgi:hypothetical protein